MKTQHTKQNRKGGQKGFTLIEILIVIGIIAILAAIVIVAINPARQFAQARDSQRTSNINTILNAIGQRMADNKGVFAGPVANSPDCPALPVGVANAKFVDSAVDDATHVRLACLTPTYVGSLPLDPSMPTTGTDTGYQVYADANGRTHIIAATQEPAIPRTTPIEIVR